MTIQKRMLKHFGKRSIRDDFFIFIISWRMHRSNKQESREIVLHQEAKLAIKEYLMSCGIDSTDWLFDYSRQSAHNALKKAFKRSGLTGTLATHTMRKTFAKTVFDNTNNIYKTKQALGHKDISTTVKYLVVDQQEINEAILKD
jgi:site-specific recombinase XerD